MELTQKDLELTPKELELTQKDLELTLKDLALTQMDLELAQKELELTPKDWELTQKDLTLTPKPTSVAELPVGRAREPARFEPSCRLAQKWCRSSVAISAAPAPLSLGRSSRDRRLQTPLRKVGAAHDQRDDHAAGHPSTISRSVRFGSPALLLHCHAAPICELDRNRQRRNRIPDLCLCAVGESVLNVSGLDCGSPTVEPEAEFARKIANSGRFPAIGCCRNPVQHLRDRVFRNPPLEALPEIHGLHTPMIRNP